MSTTETVSTPALAEATATPLGESSSAASSESAASQPPTTEGAAAQPAAEAAPRPSTSKPANPPKLGPMVSLTDAALAEVNRLREKKGLEEIILRVGVKGGGCAGLSYTMSFEENEIKPTDAVMQYPGVKLIVDRKSGLFLRGMTLNYSDDLIGGGFKFENPNAKKSCSCGTSFSA